MDRLGSFSTLASAYEGVEDFGSFDERELTAYRESALRKTDVQADFIERELRAGGRLVEVGCGNGRLLVALAQRGVIASGLGMDLSNSRIAFAQAWAAELGLESRLAFAVEDCTVCELGERDYAAAVCITGALGYFDAYQPGSARRLLERLHGSLASGGMLVLELYPHPGRRKLLAAGGGHIRTWLELGPGDPWRFYLSELWLEDEDVLVHRKTFIHRISGVIDEGRSERLTLFTPESIVALLRDCGFNAVRCLEGWSQEPYVGGEVMLVTATAGDGRSRAHYR